MDKMLYKLRLLKLHLKAWSKHTFGDVLKQSNLVRSELIKVQNSLVGNPYDSQLQLFESELQEKLRNLLDTEFQSSKQSAYIKRDLEADRNSKYFHNSMKINKVKEAIYMIYDI